MSELEALIKSVPSQSKPVPSSNKWQDLANWRRLQRGMSMDKVRALLGEPERVDAGPITFWRWAGAYLYFADGKLDGWSEPSRWGIREIQRTHAHKCDSPGACWLTPAHELSHRG